jgi:hypothetical protein
VHAYGPSFWGLWRLSRGAKHHATVGFLLETTWGLFARNRGVDSRPAVSAHGGFRPRAGGNVQNCSVEAHGGFRPHADVGIGRGCMGFGIGRVHMGVFALWARRGMVNSKGGFRPRADTDSSVLAQASGLGRSTCFFLLFESAVVW